MAVAWLFRAFFLFVAACIAVYLAKGIRNLAQKEETAPAVVQKKWSEFFPYSTGIQRKDRKEYKVAFFFPKDQKHLAFQVREEMYQKLDVGMGGMLRHRGEILVSFDTACARENTDARDTACAGEEESGIVAD